MADYVEMLSHAQHDLSREVAGTLVQRMLPWCVFGCRVFVGLVFVLAGGAKLASPGSFMATLLAYDLLPVAAQRPLALILPWVEIVTGGYLLAGFFTRTAAWMSIGLLATFSFAIGQALFRGLSLKDCGCFGDLMQALPLLAPLLGGADAGAGDIVRDVIYAALAVVVAFGPASPLSVDGVLARRAMPPSV